MRKIDGFMYDSLPPSIKVIIRKREDEWQNWTDEQVVAWIYTELGKQYSMDPNYRYGDSYQKARTELEAENFNNFYSRASRRNVTCIDLSRMMEVVLNEVFNINCRTVIDGSGPHQYNIVELFNQRMKLDLQEELHNIQSGRKLEHFGSEPYYDGKNFGILQPEQQDELLTSVGYNGIPYKNHELDSYVEQLRDDSIPTYKKLEIVLLATNLVYQNQLPHMGYCEKLELFKQCILDCIYPDKVNKNVRNFTQGQSDIYHNTIKRNGNFISCFSSVCEDGTQKHYINDGTKLKYDEISEEEFNKLFNRTQDSNDAPVL